MFILVMKPNGFLLLKLGSSYKQMNILHLKYTALATATKIPSSKANFLNYSSAAWPRLNEYISPGVQSTGYNFKVEIKMLCG